MSIFKDDVVVIDDRWELDSDTNCFVLREVGTNDDGERVVRDIKYYSKIKQALYSIRDILAEEAIPDVDAMIDALERGFELDEQMVQDLVAKRYQDYELSEG